MVVISDIQQYTVCPKCGTTDLNELLVGGVGDWHTSIFCVACLHIQKNLSFERVIVPLVAFKYGISSDKARLADLKSQEEYENVLLGGEPFDDVPAVPPVARWQFRRLRAAGEIS